MSYLISISIGPVQDFIASARRSRDLWFGSWLLSELSKAAAKSITDQRGVLIFPNTSVTRLNPNSNFNVVNKILAEILSEPEEVGTKVKEAIDIRLEEIRKKAFKNLPSQFVELEKAKIQISDLVEFFWTAIEHPDPQNYKSDRSNVEKIFSARKATRDFKQVNLWNSDRENAWGRNIPKSSLDGQRESVIYENTFDELSKEELRTNLGLKEGERLCGVGLLKRHGNRQGDDSFFSTSHVASLPFLEKLTAKNLGKKTNVFLENIKSIVNAKTDDEFYKKYGCVPREFEHPIFKRFDGHLLFKERIDELFDDSKEAQKVLQNFLGDVLGENKEPMPYYALVLADGDFMGKAIDKQETKNNHKDLSAKLSEFAGDVGKIIEDEGQGSLIYSGGDDVLAFVGLHRVLDYVKKLSDKFKESLKDFEYDIKKSPTLSVGVAVVHHLEPLEDALELVRKAEKTAKSVEGKNALSVVVDKRSGTSRIAKGTWGTIDERLKTFIRWHRENAIPDGAAYELRDLAYRLEIPDNAPEVLRKNLAEAKEKEAKRILQRKKKDFGESGIDAETIEKLKEFIRQIEATKKADENSIAILADELIIAKIFADAEDMAQMEITK